MSKTKFYQQCIMRKGTEQGYFEQTSYIPEEFCILGNRIRLRNEDDSWSDGWVIVYMSEKRPAELVEQNERDYLRTRKQSDI